MSRVLKRLFVFAVSIMAFVVISLSAFFWLAPGTSADEVARVASPQGEVEAVLVETNSGATTSFGYEVFVVPRGTKQPSTRVAHLYGAVRNSNAYGANIRWQSASELDVEFEDAKSVKLEQAMVVVSGYSVRVALRPGITDPTAPSGGMLYNLRGRQ